MSCEVVNTSSIATSSDADFQADFLHPLAQGPAEGRLEGVKHQMSAVEQGNRQAGS